MKFKIHCIYAYSCNVKEPDGQTVNKTDYLNRYSIRYRYFRNSILFLRNLNWSNIAYNNYVPVS